MSIEPWFEPGSGFYRPDSAAPGSAADMEARRAAAYRCVIYKMRAPLHGLRLQASEVRMQRPTAGGIICTDNFTYPRWHAAAMSYPDLYEQKMQLHAVRLVRMRGGFRQYQGLEYGEKALTSWKQTWFCAPNEASGYAVLEKMEAAEEARWNRL